MGVHGGDTRDAPSHKRLLHDPLTKVRSVTIAPVGLTHPGLARLSYSSSNGSDHSQARLSYHSNSSASSGGSSHPRNSLNFTLDIPTHLSRDANLTLDIPNLKIISNNGVGLSPARKSRKSIITRNSFNNSVNTAVIDGSDNVQSGQNKRKISNRSLHGVFHARLHGPLASLQPLEGRLKTKSSTRARKNRTQPIVIFNNKDKENVHIQSSFGSNDEVTMSRSLPSVLQQLTTLCRPNDTNLNNGNLPPTGLNGHQNAGDRNQQETASGRVRKVSHVIRALAGRLSQSLSKSDLATNHPHTYPIPSAPAPHSDCPLPDIPQAYNPLIIPAPHSNCPLPSPPTHSYSPTSFESEPVHPHKRSLLEPPLSMDMAIPASTCELSSSSSFSSGKIK